eukprot:m.165831 g.165831  ORF g.165831 m.165831 type:complete len:236 (+) comp16433_c0_seq3:268-975(+)
MMTKGSITREENKGGYVEQKGKHLPYGEEGAGFYSLATKGCFDVINNSTDLVMECLSYALDAYKKRNDGKPFTIADLGTADGGTSMPLITEIMKQVRKRIGNDPVVIFYEDQATNDFNSLFKRVHGIIPTPKSADDSTPIEPLVDAFENTYVVANGTSFYKQISPDNSIDIGLCATSFHWLTSAPCKIPDALHSSYSKDGRCFACANDKQGSHMVQEEHVIKRALLSCEACDSLT